MNENVTKLMLAAVALALVVGLVSPAAAAGSDSAAAVQQANETTTEAGTGDEECQPDGDSPQVQQADLHTSDEVIERGSPGRISGAIVVDAAAECPVTVQITLNVPNNVYLEGASDIGSGGGGIITNTFEVAPGEAKDIAATVYGTEPGQHSVIADITYFPVGHSDMAREIDGLTLTFTVEEPVEPEEESIADWPPTTIQWLLGIVTIAVVGLLVAVGRRNRIKIRK